MIADLHIHSRFARGCSKKINISLLSEWAKKKGLDIIGTGDFTHPEWNKELKTELKETGEGIYESKQGQKFILQTEISLMYSQDGKGRRVHHVVLAPSFDVVDQIINDLSKHGRLDYDGRPIFNIPSPDFVEMLRHISKDIEVIPAHIWTPWFGILGSKSGFNSIEEAFQDQTKYIHALETGLSSDPPMNWRLSSLDKYNLVSFSDAHSYWPWRLGREATVFNTEKSYKAIINAIRTGKGLEKTIEVDPNYGKYHYDGHRNCGIAFSPNQSRQHNYLCPKCHKPLTIGVLNRVEELANRDEGFKPKNAKAFVNLIPLSELISVVLGKATSTKTVWQHYNEIMSLGKTEMDVLLNVPIDEIYEKTDYKIAKAIELNRLGKIKFKPGYDGVYGEPILKIPLDKKQKTKNKDDRKPNKNSLLNYF